MKDGDDCTCTCTCTCCDGTKPSPLSFRTRGRHVKGEQVHEGTFAIFRQSEPVPCGWMQYVETFAGPFREDWVMVDGFWSYPGEDWPMAELRFQFLHRTTHGDWCEFARWIRDNPGDSGYFGGNLVGHSHEMIEFRMLSECPPSRTKSKTKGRKSAKRRKKA